MQTVVMAVLVIASLLIGDGSIPTTGPVLDETNKDEALTDLRFLVMKRLEYYANCPDTAIPIAWKKYF
jgi:hypothetical protein